MLAFGIALVPVLALAAPMKVLILDHRTYLPFLGVAIALAAAGRLFASVPGRAVGIGVLAVLAALTHRRLPAYAESLSLWRLGVDAAPSSDYAHNNYGAALMDALDAAAARAGADLLCEALARELWCDASGRLLGVGLQRPDGALERIACRALLLACNGFGGNPAMVREWLPEFRDAVFAGHAGNDGSAVAWGRALGARLADLQGCQGHGSWAIPQGTLVTWAVMTEGGIQVNAAGRRFHDETGGYSEAAVDVLAQPGGIAWDVIDGRLLELGRRFPDFVAAEAAGAVRKAADAGALAALIGCDAGTRISRSASESLWSAWDAPRGMWIESPSRTGRVSSSTVMSPGPGR